MGTRTQQKWGWAGLLVLQLVFTCYLPAQEALIDDDPVYTRALTTWGGGDTKGTTALLSRLGPEVLVSEKTAFLQAVIAITDPFLPEDVALQKVIEIAPQSTEGKASTLLRGILKKGDDADKALRELIQLVEEHPDRPVLAYAVALGIASRGQQQYAETEAWCVRAATMMKPGPPALHLVWANALDDQDKAQEALVHRKIARDLEPAAWTNAALGNTLTSLKRYDEANEAYAEAIQIYPAAEHWLSWGISRSKAGKRDDALVKFEESLKRDPKSLYALRWRAVTLQRLGRWEDALAEYAKLRATAPSDAYAYRNAAGLLRSLGRNAEAEKVVKEWTSAGNTTALQIEPAP